MALAKAVIILSVLALTIAEFHDEIKTSRKDKEALSAESQTRSANPGREKGSFQKLNNLMNRTDKGSRRSMENLGKIFELNRRHKAQNDEGAIAINHNAPANDTNSLAKKMKELRKEGPTYLATHKNNYLPKVTGVFCNFENTTNGGVDMCQWEWNTTLSSNGLGFKVVTAADIVKMNESSTWKFSGPVSDADDDVNGHFLYLPVDPTMENMVIKSPPFRGLWEFCKFEAKIHQSKMSEASIRLISESTMSEVQWILLEVAGNNLEIWHPMRFTIGKVSQEVRIMIEVTRPGGQGNSTGPLPHVAVDNVRMLECLPEPPVFNGECQQGQMKCTIMERASCIKLQQVCDLIKDCDDGIDENQNCDKIPYGAYCNFEHDNCGFENVPQPILKWSRHSGPTPTDKTGPDHDHTCGPPPLHPAPAPLPPLSPPHANHTLNQCIGYYFFVNMNVTGPNKEKADFASTAVMKSQVFNPPPSVHGDINSPYYNCCMVRFYYQQNGRNYGSLSLDVVELTNRGNITTSTSLWFSTKDKGENWYRAAIFLPNITRRYFLQFKTRMGMRIYSDSAIDDFSMAPECFGLNIPEEHLNGYNYYEPLWQEPTTPHPDFKDQPYYRFTPCGATGRWGPTGAMCARAYNGSVRVRVLARAPLAGVQEWTVPSEGYYTIIAMGASGGLGSAWSGVSHGALARGLFELHKGEKLYILPGQQGLNACKKTLSAQESQECSLKQNASSLYTSKTHEVRNTHVQDGGGGGGGGSFVFLLSRGAADADGSPEGAGVAGVAGAAEGAEGAEGAAAEGVDMSGAVALAVGGGGGGVSTGAFRDDGSQHARAAPPHGEPVSGYMYGQPGRTSGAGGGWLARAGPRTPGHAAAAGGALAAGGGGGQACAGAAHGGFGGGGGGCLRGGGGGGWQGGNTNQGAHGGGGYSYVDSTRSVPGFSSIEPAQHMGPGEVLIIPAIHACDCDYRCVALNEFRSEVKCFCPAEHWNMDSQDGTKCILDDHWFSRVSWVVIFILSATVLIFMFIVLCICLRLYSHYQRRKEEEVRRKRVLEQETALRRLRRAPGDALAAFNPHYGGEAFLPPGVDVRALPQVARDSLKLVKALGQGAFGEVYQGLYRHRAADSAEMPVAVKTLPELSSGQAESDFLMEAAIMAKFNHPNIVHLIGVCFDRHPRFIVLELLGGGDLKNFLRESRPRAERVSALCMHDLLLCALDVCKGCRYLEAKRFIHRDIAARNCLLTSRGPGRVVKIADFGMARDIYRADYYKKGGKAMLPIKWMPPEAYIDGVFTIKTDVWSFGVLLWEVFSLGVMPYTGCANREVMELVSGGGRLEKPFGCPQEIYRLMCECWNPNPGERPTFAHMFDRLSIFLQDPEITSAPLPVLRTAMPPTEDHSNTNGIQRAAPCDYLVPLTPTSGAPSDSLTDPLLNHHSKSPTATRDKPETEDLQYQHLLKASQEYGNIPMGGRAGAARGAGDSATTSSLETRNTTKFLPSNSTDRLLSSAEDPSIDDETASECDDKPVIWETSFTHKPEPKRKEPALAVDKLISITPTSPNPPENVLSLAMEKESRNNLSPKKKSAPIASPDPSHIHAGPCKTPTVISKPKPLCLDPAQLVQDLNALKKNSGSVNLNTMNILPPYINVVTPNKLSESKTIKIDPKKAVIHDLQSPKDEELKKEEGKLKQSSSAASLLNGPMTDVPYADSDNASSSSASNPPNHITNKQKSLQNNYSEVSIAKEKNKVKKQSSNNGGDMTNDSEISC